MNHRIHWVETQSSFNPDHLALHTGSDIPVYTFDSRQVYLSGEKIIKCELHEIIKDCLPVCEFYEYVNIAYPFLFATGKRTKDTNPFHTKVST